MCSGRGGAGWRGRVPAAASHQPNQGNGVKQGICSLLFQEHLLQDCADSPRPGAGLTELQSMGGGGDQPQHPELPLERPLHQGSLCSSPPWGRAVLAEWSGYPRNGGEQLPQSTFTKCSSPLQALWGGQKEGPQG